MEIVFTVYDLDLTASIEASSDVVDNIFVYPDIAAVAFPGDSFSNTASFSGNFSRVQLAFRLTCGPDHYGPSCSFYCTNDTDCSFPCVSQPCRNGGTCVFNSSSPHNYTCECGDDFRGDNCEEVNPCASQHVTMVGHVYSTQAAPTTTRVSAVMISGVITVRRSTHVPHSHVTMVEHVHPW